MYYVYYYLRRDGVTPYYVGKGKGDRAWRTHKRKNGAEIKPDDPSRIQIVKDNLSEAEAFELEKQLIKQHELKENGGLLVNLTYGGEGASQSKELRQHRSQALKGKPKPPRTETHKLNLQKAAAKRRGVPNPKTSKGLKEWHATNPDRSEPISKQSASLRRWYQTADKSAKAWNTWHTRYLQDYNEYSKAIELLQEHPIAHVARQTKFERDTLRKLKTQAHGVYKHFPELLQILLRNCTNQ